MEAWDRRTIGMWKCEICGHENSENEDLCEICGAYREESSYDAEADLEDSYE